jgi:hypothetical protein
MYCSSCGQEQPQELSYCNRCGNSLRPAGSNLAEQPARAKGTVEAIAAMVVLVTLGAFGMIFGLILAFLKRMGTIPDGGFALMGLVLLFMFGIDFMLIRLLTRVLHLGPGVPGNTPPKSLGEPVMKRLAEPRQPAASVTDHTTRTLPPVYAERNEPR